MCICTSRLQTAVTCSPGVFVRGCCCHSSLIPVPRDADTSEQLRRPPHSRVGLFYSRRNLNFVQYLLFYLYVHTCVPPFCRARRHASDKELPAPAPATPAPFAIPTRSQTNAVIEEATETLLSRGESDGTAAYRAYLLLQSYLLTHAEIVGDEELPPPSSSSSSSSSSPSLVSILRRLMAEALVSFMRSATGGNGLVVDDDGQIVTSDDDDEKIILWRKNAPVLLALLEGIEEDPSSDPEVCFYPLLRCPCQLFLGSPPRPSPRVMSNM